MLCDIEFRVLVSFSVVLVRDIWLYRGGGFVKMKFLLRSYNGVWMILDEEIIINGYYLVSVEYCFIQFIFKTNLREKIIGEKLEEVFYLIVKFKTRFGNVIIDFFVNVYLLKNIYGILRGFNQNGCSKFVDLVEIFSLTIIGDSC